VAAECSFSTFSGLDTCFRNSLVIGRLMRLQVMWDFKKNGINIAPTWHQFSEKGSRLRRHSRVSIRRRKESCNAAHAFLPPSVICVHVSRLLCQSSGRASPKFFVSITVSELCKSQGTISYVYSVHDFCKSMYGLQVYSTLYASIIAPLYQSAIPLTREPLVYTRVPFSTQRQQKQIKDVHKCGSPLS